MAARDPYAGTEVHRFHATRRRMSKIGLVLLMLGWLCLVLGAGVLAYAFAVSRSASRARLITMAEVYLGAGVVCFFGRLLLESIRERHFRHRRPSGRGGAVLILVLLVLVLVSALVMEAQVSARRALRREEQALLQARLDLVAVDAARQALQRLADDPDLGMDATNENWAASIEITDPAGLTTRTWVQDENRWFDLNNLALPARPSWRPAAEIVMDLLTLCGDFEPVSKVDALGDWVDDNAEGPWESPFYRGLEPPYAAADRVLLSWSELLAVRGFRRDLFDRKPRYERRAAFQADVLDQVTVIPAARDTPVPVNINTAGEDVLRGVLGLQRDELVRQLLVRRARAPLRSVDSVLAVLDPETRRAVEPYLDVRSRFFRVEVRADAEDQTVRLRVIAVRQKDGRVDVVQWWSGRAAG
ncbi:MAG: general secretion pathway protein GspK [Kiritimatiellae bacterium]|nr:general secretion pathway protein GspK [Kiritimatiellia bacterium]